MSSAQPLAGRTGAGTAALSFAVILSLAGSNDVMARFFGVPVEWITIAFRGLVVIGPPVLGYAAYAVCREIKAGGAGPTPHWVTLRRSARGGFEETGDDVRR